MKTSSDAPRRNVRRLSFQNKLHQKIHPYLVHGNPFRA